VIPKGLETLRDIHLPPEPSAWPPAVGWWFVIALLCIAGLLAPTIRLRTGRFLQRRRDLASWRALAGRAKGNDPTAAAELSVLMRSIAVRRHTDAAPAGLTGGAWLDFLESTSPENAAGGFTDGPGRRLLDLPYQKPISSANVAVNNVGELFDACRPWVEHNA